MVGDRHAAMSTKDQLGHNVLGGRQNISEGLLKDHFRIRSALIRVGFIAVQDFPVLTHAGGDNRRESRESFKLVCVKGHSAMIAHERIGRDKTVI